MVKKLTTGEFCSAAHKKAYLEDQEKFALARLIENQSRLGSQAGPAAAKKNIAEIADAHEAAQKKRKVPVKVVKAADADVPAHADFLPQPVNPSDGPRYLALPAALPVIAVPPQLPEHSPSPVAVGIEVEAVPLYPGGRASGESVLDTALPLPWVEASALLDRPAEVPSIYANVAQRVGISALFHASEEEGLQTEALRLPEPLPIPAPSANSLEFEAGAAVWGNSEHPAEALFSSQAILRAPSFGLYPESVEAGAGHGRAVSLAETSLPMEVPLQPSGWGANPEVAKLLGGPRGGRHVFADWIDAGKQAEIELQQIEAVAEAAEQQSQGEMLGYAPRLEGRAPVCPKLLDGFGPKRFAFSQLPTRQSQSLDVQPLPQGEAVEWQARVEVGGGVPAAIPLNAYPQSVIQGSMLWPKNAFGNETATTSLLAQDCPLRVDQEELYALHLPEAKRSASQDPAVAGSLEPLAFAPEMSQPRLAWGQHRSIGVSLEASLQRLWAWDAIAQRSALAAPQLESCPFVEPVAQRVSVLVRNVTKSARPKAADGLHRLEFAPGKGAALKAKLRVNGEMAFGKGLVFLPRVKLQIRPAQEAQSVFSALGHLTGGNRDFSFAAFKKHWNLAPNDLRWVAMAIPIVIGLVWYSSQPSAPVNPAEGEVAAVEQAEGAPKPGVFGRLVGDENMLELKRTIQRRAAVELSDDFRQGLADWSGVGDWASGWRYDQAGFLRPRQIAFYTPSLELSDYRFEFLGQIEKKALSWVFRAADPKNYYVNRLEIAERGPLPEVQLVRYAVIGGKAGPRKVTRLPMQVHMDTLYRVRVDVAGENFVTTIQGQVVDVFSDDRISRGGIGFFAGPGEDVRLRWVEVSHQYDFLGRLCAFLVPYNVSNNNMRSGQ